MRRHALVLFAALALSTSAMAADPEPKGKGAPGTNVEMPFLMAPINGADGKLAGYAYISTILTATSAQGALAVREKLAFIQDAFVRDVNHVTVAKKDDPMTVDRDGLVARLTADATKLMGPGQVASLTIVQLQFAPLHPKTTPQLASAPSDSPPPGPATTAAAK
jgi:hypothetical protein